MYKGHNPSYQLSDQQTREAVIAQVALLMHAPIAEVETWSYVHIQRLLAVHNANNRLNNDHAKGLI